MIPVIPLLSTLAVAHPLVAVVVVDPSARDEGYALELEDLLVDDVLPVDVAEGEHVRIVDPDGVRHELDVAPGEAWQISGPRGEAWMSRIGEDVRSDVLVVRGDADAVRSLADALHAEVRTDGDRILLVRRDILFDAPWVKADGLDRLDEVGFVAVDPADVARPTPPVAVSAAIAKPVAQPLTPARPAAKAAADAVPTAEAARAAVAPVAEAEPTVAATEPTAAPAADAPADADAHPELDPEAYVGMYACGDGTPILLDAAGRFSVPGQAGAWYVSAPGVVRLVVSGATRARAAIEVGRHYCHAVW